ncbi:MAG: hypothetical protein HY22_14430 [[Candidatus Thermochlorobacteriaceae] bacterium GBChlB]|nr:MAG: hypothetical protein HY22_14430 [[Candidatus Thermochlorobacteriaceae] bacterium GBChlB]
MPLRFACIFLSVKFVTSLSFFEKKLRGGGRCSDRSEQRKVRTSQGWAPDKVLSATMKHKFGRAKAISLDR